MKLIKRRHAAGFRVFFATDIHGSDRCFRKWLNAGRAYSASVLILGGDLTGKTLVPILKADDGWRVSLEGRDIVAETPDEQDAVRARVRAAGQYEVLVSESELAALEADAEILEDRFRERILDSVAGWVRLAEERLSESDGQCYMILGNDDFPELADTLRGSDVVTYAEDGPVALPGGYELLSFGYSTPTPWHTPRELPEEEIARRLESLVGQLDDPSRAIFNIHCPPKDTRLDQAPLLDDENRPQGDMAGQKFTSVGSAAVREAIERFQPALGLHGHVHESAGAERVGDTLCINPGSEYFLGSLRGSLVELSENGGGVLRWQMTQG